MLIRILAHMLALVLTLLVAVMPAQADPLTISGEVLYHERIALPSGSTLHVGLVALPSGRPVVGAGAAIPVRTAAPLLFNLNVRSDAVTAGGSFGLVAEIRHGEDLLFRNDQAVPVDLTNALPVSILVTRHTVAPPTEPAFDPEIVGVVWTVTSIGGRPITGQRPLTLSIAADHRVGGSGGCNSYFSEASIAEHKISFGPPAATRMACAPDIMDQETDYFAALAAVASYEHDEAGLRLLDAAGIPLIGLVRTTE